MNSLVAEKGKYIKCKNGEILSFDYFFEEYFSKFYAFTMRFVEDSYVCEDIVQDTFILIWQSKENQYDSLVVLQAYIYRMLRNKALNYLKHKRVKEAYSNECLREVESEEYMVSSVVEEEMYFVLYEAIHKLTPQCQEVIKWHLEGKSNKEIAEIMQISIVTVKSHKMLAYKELRRIIKDSASIILLFLTK